MSDLSIRTLQETSTRRAERWHGPNWQGARDWNDWNGSDWSNAMGGECGEAQNVVKKIRRGETGARAALDPNQAELVHDLGLELADTICYAVLVAEYYGIDLASAIIQKFNAVSDREGFPEKL